jgi:hypothetical protein
MGWHIQTFKLNLTYTLVEGDAESPGALGRILGDIAGHLLGRQLLVVASLGDVTHVELLPHRAVRVTLWSSSTTGQGTVTATAALRTAASSSSAVNPAGGGATQAGQPQSVAASRRMMAWKWTAPRR